METRAIVGVLTCSVCLMTTPTASAQSKTALPADMGSVHSVPGPLQKAASEALARLSQTAPQQASRRDKATVVGWGAVIGGAAGLTAGFAQPTHSNGELVGGNDRVTSALVLGSVGAGLGALIGWVIAR
jgi:hypothetical protein